MGSKSSIIYIFTFLAVAIAPAFVHAGSLPPLINFQSVLLDEGGNLLPSGSTTVQFQILDENQAPIYSETQNVEVVKGAVNALVGNGSDTKGVTTGGIPEDIFAGGAPRYLQVQVGSHAPEDPMTIVPVPYAQWSQTCATVADGAVAAGKIAKAAVGFEHLAPDVVSKLASVLTAQSLGSNGGATQIGVAAKFINSGSSSVQGVLQDIDLSVKKRQEETTFLTGKLNEEVTNRANAVKGVQDSLDFEKNASNVGSLAQKIESETTARSGADGKLQDQVNTINTTFATKQYVNDAVAASTAQNAPLSNTALIKAGSYKAELNDIIIDVGFKPTSIQIFSTNSTTDYFGTVTDTNTIMGVLEYLEYSGAAGDNIVKRSLQSLQLNGTKISIVGSGKFANKLNQLSATYYYTIWGTQ